MKRIVRLQYKNFEPGEYTGGEELDLDAALAAVHEFPWEAQRDHLQVSFTNPSLQFEAGSNFLKLALYYNGKFVLYYFDEEHLYTHSMVRVEEATPYIEDFFRNGCADLSQYKKEPTPFMNLKPHFLHQDFIYSTRNLNIWKSTDFYTKFFWAYDVLFVCMIFYKRYPDGLSLLLSVLVVGIYFVPYGGINTLLFFNYLFHSKNQELQLSRGADEFTYTAYGHRTVYKKSQVRSIQISKNTSSRAPWNGYTISYIYFDDDTWIRITSLLLGEDSVRYKFPNITAIINNTGIPWYSKDLSDWRHQQQQ